MSFDALLQKVKQAEGALEAQERQGAADWRQFKASWRAAWTPGRIVSAGLVSGFLVGRAKPLRAVSGSGALQMLSALSSLLASGSAQVAASEAEDAADAVHASGNAAAASKTTTATTAAPTATAPTPAAPPAPAGDPTAAQPAPAEPRRASGLK